MDSVDIELVLKIKSPLGIDEYIVDLPRTNADTGEGCSIAPLWERNQVTFSQMLEFFCNGGDVSVLATFYAKIKSIVSFGSARFSLVSSRGRTVHVNGTKAIASLIERMFKRTGETLDTI